MEPVTTGILIAAALSAAASVAGGVMANDQSSSNAAQGNATQVSIANANREQAAYQYATNWDRSLAMDDRNKAYSRDMYNIMQANTEYMSNTAYQRSMQDMRLAGLNPILAYQRGGASAQSASAPAAQGTAPQATTSSSSTYQHTMPHVQNVLGPAASSAMAAASTIQNLRQGMATTEQTQALTEQAHMQTQQARSQRDLNDATTALTASQDMTEQERRRYVSAQEALARQQAAESAARATGQTQENTRFDRWGPRSSAADAGANLEAAGRRAASAAPSVVSAARDAWGRIIERITPGPSGYSPSRTPWWGGRSGGSPTHADPGGYNLYP